MKPDSLIVTQTGIPLAQLLAVKGIFPDLRCGGKGRCGHCRVKVLSGTWEEAGKIIAAPAELLACRTKLLQGPGALEIPEKQDTPQDEKPFSPYRPFPAISRPVVGLDLGTTTVAGAILRDGKILRSARIANAQRIFGDNVIDRIAAARDHAAELQKAAQFSLGNLIRFLDVPEDSFFSLAGNTVMLALLCGADPGSLGHAPFAMPEMDLASLTPEALGWHGTGKVLVLPPFSAYLGGDVTAGWRETALAPGEMLADLGTNCEILYHSETKGLIGTSAAAGPAFEGSGIRFGSPVRKGVICHFPAPRQPQVYGDRPPQALSGTALADCLYWARKLDQIDRCGKCRQGHELEILPGISISDEEIALLLTAKAAVYAGITALERFAGTPAKRIFLAGDFAAHLSLSRAVAIGMLPQKREILAVGNTALSGALRAGAEAIGGEAVPASMPPVREIRPNDLPDFASLFADAMLLP